LGDATECLADHLGETIGGLLNATFGNAVEVVVMVLALLKAKNTPDQEEVLLDVVQTSLIGSIFSNSLLVLGCSFVANGIKYKESEFNVTAVSANTALLMIAAFVMLLPSTYTGNHDREDILLVSRAAAVILMAMYCLLLVFVLWTHKDIMSAEGGDDAVAGKQEMSPMPSHDAQPAGDAAEVKVVEQPAGFVVNDDPAKSSKAAEDEEHGAELTLIGSLLLLLIATCAVSWLSEYLVDAIDPMAAQLEMKPAFVGIILLPIIGNAVEHITAIRMAMKNKMDIALSIAIGSATRVAMFVVALAVFVSWCIDLEMSLAFDEFEVNLFIFSSIIIFVTISDGSSNWLEGSMLLGLYLLIAIAVYHQEYCSGISRVDGKC